MKKDKLYELLKEKMVSVSSVPQQEMGPLTFFWRRSVPHLKTTPVRIYLITALLSSFLFWLLLGETLVRITSKLQYGF